MFGYVGNAPCNHLAGPLSSFSGMRVKATDVGTQGGWRSLQICKANSIKTFRGPFPLSLDFKAQKLLVNLN